MIDDGLLDPTTIDLGPDWKALGYQSRGRSQAHPIEVDSPRSATPSLPLESEDDDMHVDDTPRKPAVSTPAPSLSVTTRSRSRAAVASRASGSGSHPRQSRSPSPAVNETGSSGPTRWLMDGIVLTSSQKGKSVKRKRAASVSGPSPQASSSAPARRPRALEDNSGLVSAPEMSRTESGASHSTSGISSSISAPPPSTAADEELGTIANEDFNMEDFENYTFSFDEEEAPVTRDVGTSWVVPSHVTTPSYSPLPYTPSSSSHDQPSSARLSPDPVRPLLPVAPAQFSPPSQGSNPLALPVNVNRRDSPVFMAPPLVSALPGLGSLEDLFNAGESHPLLMLEYSAGLYPNNPEGARIALWAAQHFVQDVRRAAVEAERRFAQEERRALEHAQRSLSSARSELQLAFARYSDAQDRFNLLNQHLASTDERRVHLRSTLNDRFHTLNRWAARLDHAEADFPSLIAPANPPGPEIDPFDSAQDIHRSFGRRRVLTTPGNAVAGPSGSNSQGRASASGSGHLEGDEGADSSGCADKAKNTDDDPGPSSRA